MLAFLATVPAIKPEATEVEAPALPSFTPRWWYRSDRLDARPVAWSLRNRPQDWRWRTENITLEHVPSRHVFWVGNGPMFYGLHEADCSCKSTRGRFQRLQARFVFGPAYRHWRNNHGRPRHDPVHFAAHFVTAHPSTIGNRRTDNATQ